MSKKLKGLTIAITGAGSGIGQQLAKQFSALDCNLSLSDINSETLAETCKQIDLNHTQLLSQQLDTSDKKAIYEWAKQTNNHFNGVDIIINNAGTSLSATAESTSDEDFEHIMQVNFWGVIHGSRAFLPYIRSSQCGHIVNISSLFGLIGAPNQSAYCASKFAVRGFTESLQEEMIITKQPITVSCVHPGGIQTNIVNNGIVGNVTGGTSEQDYRTQFNQIAITTAKKAAKTIIKGIANKEHRILVGKDAKAIDKLQRLIPGQSSKLIAWSAQLTGKVGR